MAEDRIVVVAGARTPFARARSCFPEDVAVGFRRSCSSRNDRPVGH